MRTAGRATCSSLHYHPNLRSTSTFPLLVPDPTQVRKCAASRPTRIVPVRKQLLRKQLLPYKVQSCSIITMASRVAMVLACAAGVSGFRIGYSASLAQGQVTLIRWCSTLLHRHSGHCHRCHDHRAQPTSSLPPARPPAAAAVTNSTWTAEDRGAQLEVWRPLGGGGGGGGVARWQKI